MLHRSSSIALANHIVTNKARLTVIDPFRRVPLQTADFDEITPLAEGSQGMIYAVLVHIEGDDEEYRYVVKRLRKVRALPSNSISGSPSAGTFDMGTPAEQNHGLIDILPAKEIQCDGFSFGARSIASARSRKKKLPSFASHAAITSESESICDHNIIKLIHVINHNDEEYALLPYCDLFLDIFLETGFNSLQPEEKILLSCEIMLDLLHAVSYLNYQKDFVHRDIKPENIALCQDRWCLVDLECAVKADSKVKKIAGSAYYMHPWCFIDTNHSALPGNDLYAVGQVLRDLLSLPSMYYSKGYYDLVNEKVMLHKAKRDAKWLYSIDTPYTESNSAYGKLTRLTEQMCDLMSNQPSIDDVVAQIRDIYNEAKSPTLSPVSSDQSSLFSELYKSSRTDGFFSSSKEKVDTYMQEMPKMLERRRSSWGGVLVERDDDSSTDDDMLDSKVSMFSGQ